MQEYTTYMMMKSATETNASFFQKLLIKDTLYIAFGCINIRSYTPTLRAFESTFFQNSLNLSLKLNLKCL